MIRQSGDRFAEQDHAIKGTRSGKAAAALPSKIMRLKNETEQDRFNPDRS
jgi:hypothetical protein